MPDPTARMPAPSALSIALAALMLAGCISTSPNRLSEKKRCALDCKPNETLGQICHPEPEGEYCRGVRGETDLDAGLDGGGDAAADGSMDASADAEADAGDGADAGDAGRIADGGDADTAIPDCENDTDCPDPKLARCTEEGICAGCSASSQCTGIAGTEVCDVGTTECVECLDKDGEDKACTDAGKICRSGGSDCVECEPSADDPESENCANGKACDPESLTCIGQTRASLGTCGDAVGGTVRCISDSECVAGTRCVMTQFKGAEYGRYCLQLIGDDACPNTTRIKRAAESVLGVADNYCFVNDTFTTCEAMLDFGNGCTDAADCGADVDDARCEDSTCTYSCSADRDCAGTDGCIGGSVPQYCNPN